MLFKRLSQSVRLLALTAIFVSLASCDLVGQGDGPDEVIDPLFVNVVPVPGPVDDALAVFSDTSTATVLPITSVTNSIDFTGNNTVADLMSTAVTPVEGCNVLSIDYQNTGSTFGGAILNFGGADLSTFDTLHFTIDTSAIVGFADMTIQMEPPGAGAVGTNVLLSSYTPVSTSGNWRTYAIPLADFPSTNFSAVANLGFWNVVNAGSALVFGTLYLDNIYYTAGAGVGAGTGGCGVSSAALAVFSDTSTASVLPITSVTNSIDFTGNNTVADLMSTAITPVEGCNVLSIDYQDSGSSFGGAILNFGAVDLTAMSFDTLHFTIDTSAIAGFADMTIQMEPPGGGAAGSNVLLSAYTPVSTAGNWRTFAIPLADFTTTDFSILANLGFWNVVDAGSALIFGTLYLDNIYYTAGSGDGAGSGGCVTPPAGGELVTNGTFETGDTSGWALVANDGTFTATMDQAASGAWSGNLVASVPGGGGPASFPVASQNGMAAGTATPGQSVTVSFDVCGELSGAGGVIQTALLSEIAGGGASDTNALFGNITPTSTWVNYAMTVLSGADVTGGLTLQLKSDCGGNPGCTVNAYFDNVSVVLDSDVGNPSNAGGACPAAPPPPMPDGLPVDFEDAGGPYMFGDFGGGATSIIDNPDMTGNSSAKVAQHQKFMDQTFGGTTLTLDGAIDFSSSEMITMKVWSSRVAAVTFKIEDGGDTTSIVNTAGAGWETLTFDFTGRTSGGISAVSIFFDNGTLGDAAGVPADWTFYLDDIELVAPVVALPVDFEDAGGPYVFGDFGGGATSVIDNPDMTGNASAKVAQHQKFMDQTFGGTTLTLDAAIDFSSSEMITMKVWSSRVAAVTFKIEDGGDTTSIVNTAGAGWETLTFDFTGRTSGGISAVSIFFDNGTLGDAAGFPNDWTFYLDDIELASPPPPMGGNLTTNGDFEAGDISGWEDFSALGNGTFVATNTQANGGTFSGNLTASVPGGGGPVSAPVVKQANIGIGTVMPNTNNFISFDLFGSVSGAGGVFFAEYFSELTGGGTSSAVILGGGPLFPTGTWTTYTFTQMTGADVSGGVTLQLKADCGSNAGCTVDAFIDNVCVSDTPGVCF